MANDSLGTIVSIQPKESSGGAGETREAVVWRMADEMLEKLPEDFLPHEVCVITNLLLTDQGDSERLETPSIIRTVKKLKVSKIFKVFWTYFKLYVCGVLLVRRLVGLCLWFCCETVISSVGKEMILNHFSEEAVDTEICS